MTDRPEDQESRMLDLDKLMRMAAEPDENFAPSSDDELKEALRRQSYADHFLAIDESDLLTNDQLWESLPKPWLQNGEEA